jgi:hypothetical protein
MVEDIATGHNLDNLQMLVKSCKCWIQHYQQQIQPAKLGKTYAK